VLCPYRIFVFFQITKIRPNLNSSQELVHSSQKLGHSIAVSLPHTCVFPNHKNQTEPQPKHLTLYFSTTVSVSFISQKSAIGYPCF
jgi:hypothetical protein